MHIANTISSDFMFSSKLLIQALKSKRPTKEPHYTHTSSETIPSLPPSLFGNLSVSKPFSVGHYSFCLWIKMWRRPTQKTTACFMRQACNLGKIKCIKLIWQDPFSFGSGRQTLTKRSSLNSLLKESYFSCSIISLWINVKLKDLYLPPALDFHSMLTIRFFPHTD